MVRLLAFLLIAPAFALGQTPAPGCAKVTATGGITGTGGLNCGTVTGAPLTIPNQVIPSGTLEQTYSYVVAVTGGTQPYINQAITAGSLPQGLSLQPTTTAGVPITGTPTGATGSSTFTLRVCDSEKPSVCVSSQFTITIGTTQLAIDQAQTCISGYQGQTGYSCTIRATGGTPNYTWTYTGTLPGGLTFASGTPDATISGNPNATATNPITLTVTDTSSPVETASLTLTLTITATIQCGFPQYNCAYTSWDYLIHDPTLPSSTTPPLNTMVPDAGCQTAGPNGIGCPNGLNHCTPGDDATTDTSGNVTKAGLRTCGNIYGINTIMYETEYATPSNPKGIEVIRVTDWNDYLAGCFGPSIGPGGDANWNVFDSTDNYFLIGCSNGNNFLKWFDPVALQVHVSATNAAGYVLTSPANPQPFKPPNSEFRGAFAEPATFYSFGPATPATVGQCGYCQAFKYQITTSGNPLQAYATTAGTPLGPYADWRYGIPCWTQSTGVTYTSDTPDCVNWTPSTAYPAGSNIIPAAPNNAANPHSFQLINGPCTSGTATPDFVGAAARIPTTAPDNDPDAGQYVVVEAAPSSGGLDGNGCEWADMEVPAPDKGGRNAYGDGGNIDATDTIYGEALGSTSVAGGQDGRGTCYVIAYNSNGSTVGPPPSQGLGPAAFTAYTYSHLNSCTGNVYNTVCTGGTTYNCAGGTFARTYVGNVYTNCTTSTFCGNNTWNTRKAYIVMHGINFFKSGWFIGMGFNFCALYEYNTSPLVPMPGTCINQPNNTIANDYLWETGTDKMWNTYAWLNTGTPGHNFPGYGQLVYNSQQCTDPFLYQSRILFAGPPSVPLWDMSKPPACTPVPPATSCIPGCTPYQTVAGKQYNGCWYPGADPTVCGVNTLARGFSSDQHGSQTPVTSADNTPVVMGLYQGQGGYGATIWPSQHPWAGEIIAMPTGKGKQLSNQISREGYPYNTGTAGNGNPTYNISGGTAAGSQQCHGSTPNGSATGCSWIFNQAFNIGTLSSSGRFWGASTDWYCTLGNNLGGPVALCGFPYQMAVTQSGTLVGHTYAVNELVGPIGFDKSAPDGRIYRVTYAGTTDAAAMPPSTKGSPAPNVFWCGFTPATLVGSACTVSDNLTTTNPPTGPGVQMQYQGYNDAQVGVFLFVLQ